MQIQVLLFGPHAEAIGRDKLALTFDQSQVDCQTLLAKLIETCPAHATLFQHGRLAINCAYAKPTDLIRNGDEVAFVGMISGG